MKNLSNSLKLPLIPKSVWLGLILALAGFTDAFYLTLVHYQNKIPPCSIGSCETVLTSKYAMIGPIPVSLIGLLYYVVIFGCLVSSFHASGYTWLRIWRKLSTVGFLVTLVLLGLQFFVLHAVCLYCMVSAVISILLFIASMAFKKPNSQPSHV